MNTLADFIYTDSVHDVLAVYVNRLLASTLRSEYKNVEVLSGDVELEDGDTPIQNLDCNGANRDVFMPEGDADENHLFFIFNGSDSGEVITVRDYGDTVTLAEVAEGEGVLLLPVGDGSYFAVGGGGASSSLYDAHTILAATTDDTPAALTVGEQTVVGRITGGNIAALTASQLATLLSSAASLYPVGPNVDGFTLSNNATDSEHDIDISAGFTLDSTYVYPMRTISTMVKRLDATFVAGTNQGGLDTGAPANDTFYYVWVIRKDSDASIDFLFSTSTTSPTMPSGYTYKKFTGWAFRTDGSANIIGFIHVGNRFYYKSPPGLEVNTTSLSTTRLTSTRSYLPAQRLIAVCNINIDCAASPSAVYFSNSELTDLAVSASATPLGSGGRSDGALGTFLNQHILTDASGTFSFRAGAASTTLRVAPVGWIVPTGSGGGASGGGATLADGDYGDVTVSGSGTVISIDNNAVTLAKLATQAANTILAEVTGSTAVPTAVAIAANKFLARASAGNLAAKDITDFALTLLDDADASAMRTTLGLVIGTNVQAWDADLDTWAGKTAPSGTVIGTTDTQTLTNKRVTPRTGTVSSSATPTINTDNVDYFSITALAVDITSMTTNLSGTPTAGQKLWISIIGTATRAITWGASFEASTIALPTTTSGTNRLDIGFVWNEATSKWRCIGYV